MLSTDTYGRTTMHRTCNKKKTGFIKLVYCNRALEWLNIRRLLHDLLIVFHFSYLCSLVDDITFAWAYHEPLSLQLYKPAAVFKKFSFVNLLNEADLCACTTALRLKKFCDPLTVNEMSQYSKPSMHVRSMDMSIIQHKELRQAVAQGLNHIPLQPTDIAKAIAVVMSAYEQFVLILDLVHLEFPIVEARSYLHATCLNILKRCSQTNKSGFKVSGRFLFDIPAVQNETKWLLQHLYCSGLDKAANNACFICIKHIRLMAYERLMGNDFLPCKNGSIWSLPTTILDQTSFDLRRILPEFMPQFQTLPYLMATYKQHKGKYRWLTNAFQTVFSNIALLLTISSKLMLESFKTWAHTRVDDYRRFLGVKTSIYWIIDSIIDTALNLPGEIHDIYVADICRCYESIPLQGPDNLLDAISFVATIAFKQASLAHPRASTKLWIRTAADGSPVTAKWTTHHPQYGTWTEFSQQRLLGLHEWLISNCFITLGDRVWRQCMGIPMGFSCSPIWCNMYLLSYETKFIQRLAKLGRIDLLSKFQHPFCYIDDLCLLNVQNPREFLSPLQPRTVDNPYWMYPLNVLDIKEETSGCSLVEPSRGTAAHFMNMEICINETCPQNFSIRKFDKRRNLPFTYTQYIKFRSNRPVHQAYNIAISQVLPILYISNSTEAVMEEIHILISTMAANGFYKPRLLRILHRFLSNGHFPGIKLNIEDIYSSLIA